MPAGEARTLDVDGLGRLMAALRGRGYELVGPRVRDDAVVLDEVEGLEDLPRGWGDDQAPGRYRLVRRDDDAFFGYAVGPHSPKREFLAPEEVLWTSEVVDEGFVIRTPAKPERLLALFGARPCEVAAVAIQDRVLRDGDFRDERYAARREGVFVVVANCGAPAPTCFCTSMDTGPRARGGFDLALTEILPGDGGGSHRFLVESGSDAGAEVLQEVEGAAASDADTEAADAVLGAAREKITRRMDVGVEEALKATLESRRYPDIASRCLSCANCTMVCPTCFCTGYEDVPSLAGESSDRVRRWDSCYSEQFSYIHGGPIRTSIAARYRQWITHKLSSWHDQFGSSGCVGCGRCITWCPPGIDITEEAAGLLAEHREAREGGEG